MCNKQIFIMTHNILKTSLLLMLASVIVFSCKKNEDDNHDQPAPNVEYKYSGSASYGDLITFDINQTTGTYNIYNQTTGVSSGGNYTVMPGNFSGIYQINAGSYSCYAVELNDRILAANFPTGNPGNNISYGISQAINNVGNESNIAGSYIYMHFSENPVNGSAQNKEWGIISLHTNGTFYVKPYATGGTGSLTSLGPESFALPLPLTSGDLDGGWQVNGTNKEQIDVTFTQMPGQSYRGFSYATPAASVFLLDMGTGEGFILGLKIATYSIGQLAGAYKMVGVVNGGTRLGNNVIVDAAGNGSVFTIDQNQLVSSESIQNLTQCANLPNVLYGNHLTGTPPTVTGKIYVVIVGNMAMYFIFDNSGYFNAYGAGAMIQ